MKTFISDLIKNFLIINSAIMLIVWINISGSDLVWTAIFPQIFCAGFLTALVTTLFFSFNPKKPLSLPVRVILHIAFYLVLCLIILGLSLLFGWFDTSIKSAFKVALSVAGVYVITAAVSYVLSKNEADEMTDALKNFEDR
ncbi:MAG: DUF3021 family protein [Lachnospiraceae bacterium]|nr:DUF3021 family protein [Lachnospiraceae bacterium]